MIRLRTLGALELHDDSGRRLDAVLVQPKRLALLVHLAAARPRGVCRRDQLLSLFWPELDVVRARDALNQALRFLRQELGPDAFVRRGGDEVGVAAERLWCDVIAFRDAVEAGRPEDALELYRGDFLNAFQVEDCRELEEWMERERAALRGEAAEAARQVAETYETGGDLSSAIAWARRALALAPDDEPWLRRLLRLHHRAGDRAGALRAYADFAHRLRAEYSSEPSPETAAVARALVDDRRGETLTPPTVVPNETAPSSSIGEADGSAHATPAVAVATRSRRPAIGPPTEPSSAFGFRRWRPPTRRWMPWLGVGAGLAGAAWLTTIVADGPRATRIRTVTQLTLGQATETEPALSPDGKWIAFAASRVGEARTWPNVMRVYVQQVPGGRAIPVTNDSTVDQRSPVWSPDGSRIAFRTPAGIDVVPALGGTPERLVSDAGRDLRLGGWSHDGTHLLFADTLGVWMHDLHSGRSRLVTRTGFGAHSPTWSPDDSSIAFVVGTGGMANIAPSQVIVISATGERADTMTDAVHLNTSPVFAPDGRSLYFVSNRDGSRDIFQLELRRPHPGGRAVRLTTGANARSISISARGDYLVYSAEIMRSNLWSSKIDGGGSGSAAPMRRVTLGDQEVECVSVSRDAQWLLYDSNKSGNQDIYKMPINGGDPIQLTTDPADDFCAMMSADGREIAFYSFRLGGTRRVFTMLANGQRQEVALENEVGDQEWAPDWSPDGRGIAFTAARTGGARFISTITRAAGNKWGDRRDYRNVPAGAVRWSHDGRYLATVSDSAVIVMSPNGEGVRVVVPQSVIGDAKPAYVTWGPDSRVLYYRTFEPSGTSSFWAVPVDGGRPRLLLALNDPLQAARRVEFATDGKRLFFTLSGDAASIWRLELRP